MITKQETIIKVIEHLNVKVQSEIPSNDRVSVLLIGGLFDRGISLMDFISVIDYNHKRWKGTKYATYLRPQTLFGNKFHTYLYESRTTKDRFQKLQDSVERAKSAFRGVDKDKP